MNKYTRIIFLAVSLLIFNTSFSQNKSIKKLDTYFEQAIKDWNIPGMGVAIVKDGEVLLAKGYGVKDVATGEPVDENTLFAIASNSKAFTSAALATLVDDGLINWDDKVRDYLPYFELYDRYVSDEFTIEDLLCHRSGLATFSGDLIWYGSSHSREEVIRRAKYLEPKFGFRDSYGYQNIMFLAAGEIIPVVTGKSWEEYIQEKFLTPLGMNNTLTSVTQFTKETNLALPHNEENGKNHAIDWVNWDNIAPAGAILSSVSDLTLWMNLQLNMGMLDTTSIWTEQRAHEMWTVHTAKSLNSWNRSTFPSKTFAGYGLGWDLYNYHGKKIVNHGGGYDGMISKTVLVPEENLGFVFLTNNINWLPSALAHQVLDEFLGADEYTDWGAKYLEYKTGSDEQAIADEKAAEEARIKDTKPSLPLEAYAGTYGGDMYGNCTVRIIGDQLAFQFEPTPLFRGTMRHWHYDTFQLNWGSDMMLPSGTVQFVLNPKGEVEEMLIDVPNPDFDFTELEFKKLQND